MKGYTPLTLIIFILILITSVISVAPADESLTVSYSISRNASYTGPLGRSWDVTVTLESETIYSCSVDEVQPGTSTCHLNVAPHSGTLTVDYDIHRPVLPPSIGSKSIPLPQGGQELLGDSPPIVIPIDDIGTITIVIHGHLSGDLSTNIGSAIPTSLEWSTWETKDTVVSADAETVLLTMETKYSVSFTVTVSVLDFDVVSKDIPLRHVSGNPLAEFVVPIRSSQNGFPELPIDPRSLWILVIIIAVAVVCTIIFVIVRKRKISSSPASATQRALEYVFE